MNLENEAVPATCACGGSGVVSFDRDLGEGMYEARVRGCVSRCAVHYHFDDRSRADIDAGAAAQPDFHVLAFL